jgi:hypothetical protein
MSVFNLRLCLSSASVVSVSRVRALIAIIELCLVLSDCVAALLVASQPLTNSPNPNKRQQFFYVLISYLSHLSLSRLVHTPIYFFRTFTPSPGWPIFSWFCCISGHTLWWKGPTVSVPIPPPNLNLMHDWILNTTSDVLVFNFLAHVLIFIAYLRWYNTSATSHPIFCIYPPNICHTQQITVKYVQLCPLLIVFSFFLSIQSSPLYSLPLRPLYFVLFILLFLFVSFLISNFSSCVSL